MKGNNVAVTHGGKRKAPLADVEASELYRDWLVDLGGVDLITAGQRTVLRRAAEADAIADTAFRYLRRTEGGLTSRRVQCALTTLRDAAGTVFRAASLLGLQRRAKPVPNLDQYLSGKENEVRS